MKKVFFFNLIVVSIIFLSLEFFLRTFDIIELQGFEKDTFYTENDTIYHKPNVLTSSMGKKFKTDENGFRIPIEKYNYNINLQTLLILGDSVSFGVSVEEKNTFVGILRKELNKNLFNSSVAGHRMQNYPFLIKKYNNQFPNIKDILVFLCINDIVVTDGVIRKEKLKFETNEYNNFFYKILKNDFFLKLNFYLREKSTVFNLLKAVGTQNVKRHYQNIVPYYENKTYLDEYEKNLNKIIKYSKNNKLNVKFILLPYKYQIKKNCISSVMNPQKKINYMFKRLNYQLFDFSSDFCKRNSNNLFLNFDPMHLSSDGHKFVSDLLTKKGIVN
ncbi:hypothetical protein OA669_00490 [Candidatus Pelagibacter bacterium]|nr:hypothetical protein [Candidatus Pelagibacter bacterium]